MRMRHAAVVAGLSLGLMSGAAKAATLEYSVIVPFNDGRAITGTIDTDYKPGTLSQSDITNFDLFYAGVEFTPSIATLIVSGNSLRAVGNSIDFIFNNSNSEFIIFDNTSPAGMDFYAGPNVDPYYLANTDSSRSEIDPPVGTVLTIGKSEGSVSAVPLPASASMFGAALLALGAVSYGVKRKEAAAEA